MAAGRLERELLVGRRLERQPVQRRDALALDRLAVLGRRVADVRGELPARVQRVGAVHEAVARDLGDDRGGGDRGARRVAVDDRRAARGPKSGTAKPSRGRAAGPRDARERVAQRGEVRRCRPRASMPRTQRETTATRAAVRSTIGYSSSRASARVLLGVVERARARGRSRDAERARGRTARRRRRAGRPGSRGRPRRRRRRSGRRARGRSANRRRPLRRACGAALRRRRAAWRPGHRGRPG